MRRVDGKCSLRVEKIRTDEKLGEKHPIAPASAVRSRFHGEASHTFSLSADDRNLPGRGHRDARCGVTIERQSYQRHQPQVMLDAKARLSNRRLLLGEYF